MDIADLKQTLQDHFTDGLVTIVGTGLSVAEGVPGMGALAEYLQEEIPARLPDPSKPVWAEIAAELEKGTDLETTLLQHPPDSALESTIVELTAALIEDAERVVIEEVVAGRRTLRFSRLLQHMLKPNTGIPIVTTNYDRLIEVAAEAVGLGVDTLFVGHSIGRLNPKHSQYSLCRGIVQRKRSVQRTYADHLVVLKPHGSLDWYLQNDEPIRCPLPLSGQRLIITPGLNKFRGGYDRPFDTHRERANKEIDNAARFLIIGYGFNDDHLQTHLEHQLNKGKPAVLVTHSLTPKAVQLVTECDQFLAITADPDKPGAVVTQRGASTFFPTANIWDLEEFISEVLEP